MIKKQKINKYADSLRKELDNLRAQRIADTITIANLRFEIDKLKEKLAAAELLIKEIKCV